MDRPGGKPGFHRPDSVVVERAPLISLLKYFLLRDPNNRTANYANEREWAPLQSLMGQFLIRLIINDLCCLIKEDATPGGSVICVHLGPSVVQDKRLREVLGINQLSVRTWNSLSYLPSVYSMIGVSIRSCFTPLIPYYFSPLLSYFYLYSNFFLL